MLMVNVKVEMVHNNYEMSKSALAIGVIIKQFKWRTNEQFTGFKSFFRPRSSTYLKHHQEYKFMYSHLEQQVHLS